MLQPKYIGAALGAALGAIHNAKKSRKRGEGVVRTALNALRGGAGGAVGGYAAQTLGTAISDGTARKSLSTLKSNLSNIKDEFRRIAPKESGNLYTRTKNYLRDPHRIERGAAVKDELRRIKAKHLADGYSRPGLVRDAIDRAHEHAIESAPLAALATSAARPIGAVIGTGLALNAARKALDTQSDEEEKRSAVEDPRIMRAALQRQRQRTTLYPAATANTYSEPSFQRVLEAAEPGDIHITSAEYPHKQTERSNKGALLTLGDYAPNNRFMQSAHIGMYNERMGQPVSVDHTGSHTGVETSPLGVIPNKRVLFVRPTAYSASERQRAAEYANSVADMSTRTRPGFGSQYQMVQPMNPSTLARIGDALKAQGVDISPDQLPYMQRNLLRLLQDHNSLGAAFAGDPKSPWHELPDRGLMSKQTVEHLMRTLGEGQSPQEQIRTMDEQSRDRRMTFQCHPYTGVCSWVPVAAYAQVEMGDKSPRNSLSDPGYARELFSAEMEAAKKLGLPLPSVEGSNVAQSVNTYPGATGLRRVAMYNPRPPR